MTVRGNLVSIAAVACAVLLADKWISVRASIPADASMQSDFLRIYDPVPLLNSFLEGCRWRASVASESAESPGYLFLNDARNVSYTRVAQTDLCDRSEYPLAVAALHRSALSALRYFDCQVSSDNSTAGRRVRITYRCGTRTTGIVTTAPAPGARSAFLTLKLEEEWSVRTPS
jgi:hypothetical protein